SGFAAPIEYSRTQLFRRTIWEIIDRLLVRPSPRWAYGWRRFWINLFGGKVHRSACVRHHVRILHPWLLEVGQYSMIGEGTVIWNVGALTVGEHTLISQDVYLCGGSHD